MRKSMILASLAALGLGGTALASDLNYSFVELGWQQAEFDDLDADGDGFGVRGSMAFTDALHGFVSYSDQSYDFDVGGEFLEVGVGYAWSMSPKLDIVGRLAYLDTSFDIPGFGDVSDDGFALGGYLRGKPMENLELTGGIDLVDYSDGGSDEQFGLGARYFFTKQFAAGLDMSFNDFGTTYTLGGRMSFGQ
jgi:hypothetical protein